MVGISGIDTRAVTRRIRDEGAMRAGVFSGDAFALGDEEQLAQVRQAPDMAGRNLSAEVSTQETYTIPAVGSASDPSRCSTSASRPRP